MVFKDGKILLGKRTAAHGAGEYGLPGGHLEYMESIMQCAKREVREEAGIEITNVRFLRVMNLIEYAPKHYLDIGMTADWESGEPRVCEPEKSAGWDWYDLDNLPTPLFKTIFSFISAVRTGKNFFDIENNL